MAVPLLDLKQQYSSIEADVLEALRQVCSSQNFILGPHVSELERRIADYSGCGFGVGVSSGTDALLLALMALDIGLGDEVITSPYTFFATGGAIARLGARPLFCDIDPLTYNLAPSAVTGLIRDIGEKTGGVLLNRTTGGTIKALVPVHLYGQMADMNGLIEIARRHRLKVIEDAAQALGAEDGDAKRAGAAGDIGCFSFFPSKNLGAFGDGGMCTTKDAALAERMKVLRGHGAKPKYYHAEIGGNFRLDELQAAVLLVKLDHLDRWTGQRQENARYYAAAFLRAGLSGTVITPASTPGYRHVYNQYVVRVPQRDALKAFLAGRGIGTETYYPVPLHVQECFSHLGYRPEDCPQSMRAAAETLAIPIYPELTDAQKNEVVEAIASFYR